MTIDDLPADMPAEWEVDGEEALEAVGLFQWLVDHCAVPAAEMAGKQPPLPTNHDVVRIMVERSADVGVIVTLMQDNKAAAEAVAALDELAADCPGWSGSVDDWPDGVPLADGTFGALQPLELSQVGDRSTAWRAVTLRPTQLLFADQVRWRHDDVVATVTLVWPPAFFAGRGEFDGPAAGEVEAIVSVVVGATCNTRGQQAR